MLSLPVKLHHVYITVKGKYGVIANLIDGTMVIVLVALRTTWRNRKILCPFFDWGVSGRLLLQPTLERDRMDDV